MMPKILDTNKFTTSPRFNDISVLRVIAMLLVVFYHCLCPYSIWDNTDYFIGFHVQAWDVVDGMLAQIHLPIFFMISGYLFGYKRNMGGYSETAKFVKDKMVRVLSPYLIMGIFLCLIQQRDLEQLLYGISHLWFLLVIFECYILGKIIERLIWIRKRWLILLMILSVLFLVGFSYRLPSIRALGISFLVHYFPYYMIGMLACRFDFSSLSNYRRIILVALVLLLVGFLLEQIYYARMALTALFGAVIVGMIFCFSRSSKVGKIPSWVMSLDKCSMGIYIVHHILIQEVNGLYMFHQLACEYYYTYPVIQFVLVTLVSWGFVAICRKNKFSKYVLG